MSVYHRGDARGLRQAVGAEGSIPSLVILTVVCLLVLARIVAAQLYGLLDTKEEGIMQNTTLLVALAETVHALVEAVGMELVVSTPLF